MKSQVPDSPTQLQLTEMGGGDGDVNEESVCAVGLYQGWTWGSGGGVLSWLFMWILTLA